MKMSYNGRKEEGSGIIINWKLKGHIAGFIKSYSYGIHKKIFYPFSFLSLVLILLLTLVTSTITTNYMMKNTYENIKGLVYQTNYNIDTAVNAMMRIALNLSNDRDIYVYFDGNDTGALASYKIQTKILQTVNYFGELYPYSDIDVYTENNRYTVSSNSQHDTLDYTQFLDKIGYWYRYLLNSDTDIVFLKKYTAPGLKDNTEKMAVVRKYYSNDEALQGFIVFSLNNSFFDDLLNAKRFNDGKFQHAQIEKPDNLQFITVTDEDGNIIYSSNRDLQNFLKGREAEIKRLVAKKDYTDLIRINGSNYFVTSASSKITKLNVISFNSIESIKKDIININRTIYGIVLLFILIMLVTSYFISKMITNPIKKLSGVMTKAEITNDVVYVNIERNDEIGELSHSFNVMMKKFVENQMLRKEAEISALQQQINPHFLYNTLGAINSISQVYGCEEITVISEKLADMFRYSINRDFHEFVRVQEEINHIENYLTIQQIRFGNKFEVKFEIDDELLNCRIIKFVLQPLVENAIYHGLEKKIDNGTLTIKAYRDGADMSFEIIDDGVGMSEDEIQKIYESINLKSNEKVEKKRGSIGLKNVHARVQLLYGDKYGIKIISSEGRGTTVKLVVPIS